MYESGFDGSAGAAMFGMIGWLFIIGLYLYFSYTMYRIANKTGYSDVAWWAWLPIVNTFLLIKMAGKEWWWFLTLFIPIVNIVMFGIMWVQIAKNCGKPPLWGVMILVPFINFVAVGVLAFSSKGSLQAPPPYETDEQPKQPTHVG